MVEVSGFRVEGLGVRFECLVFKARGFGLGISGSGFRV